MKKNFVLALFAAFVVFGTASHAQADASLCSTGTVGSVRFNDFELRRLLANGAVIRMFTSKTNFSEFEIKRIVDNRNNKGKIVLCVDNNRFTENELSNLATAGVELVILLAN